MKHLDFGLPVGHELLELARYWANVAIDIEYEWFLTEQIGTTDMRLNPFAWRRADRIYELLGDAVSKVVDEVYQEYGKKQNPKFWNAFLNGTGEQLERTAQGF